MKGQLGHCRLPLPKLWLLNKCHRGETTLLGVRSIKNTLLKQKHLLKHIRGKLNPNSGITWRVRNALRPGVVIQTSLQNTIIEGRPQNIPMQRLCLPKYVRHPHCRPTMTTMKQSCHHYIQVTHHDDFISLVIRSHVWTSIVGVAGVYSPISKMRWQIQERMRQTEARQEYNRDLAEQRVSAPYRY